MPRFLIGLILVGYEAQMEVFGIRQRLVVCSVRLREKRVKRGKVFLFQ